MKQFKVENLYVICTVDIVKEEQWYTQVLKMWELLSRCEDISKFVKRLENMFVKCTDDFVKCCNEKHFVGYVLISYES